MRSSTPAILTYILFRLVLNAGAAGILEDLLHIKEDIISGLLSPFSDVINGPENCGCPCRHFLVTHCEKSFVEDCHTDFYHKETCSSVPVWRPVRSEVTECQKCFRYNEQVPVTRWVVECHPVYDQRCRTRYERHCVQHTRCIELYQTICQNDREDYAQHCRNEPREHCYPETKCSKTPRTKCVPVKKEQCAKVPREATETQPRSSCLPFEHAIPREEQQVDCQTQNRLISGPLITQTAGIRSAVGLSGGGGGGGSQYGSGSTDDLFPKLDSDPVIYDSLDYDHPDNRYNVATVDPMVGLFPVLGSGPPAQGPLEAANEDVEPHRIPGPPYAPIRLTPGEDGGGGGGGGGGGRRPDLPTEAAGEARPAVVRPRESGPLGTPGTGTTWTSRRTEARTRRRAMSTSPLRSSVNVVSEDGWRPMLLSSNGHH